MKDVCGLEYQNWLASQMDRCATNLAAIRKLKAQLKTNTFLAPCCAHTLAHCGDHFDGEDVKYFFSKVATMMMHKGNATLKFKDVFQCTVQRVEASGGG